MKLVEKDLTVKETQALLENLVEESIDATISISIETKNNHIYLGNSDEKYRQITMDDIDAEDVDDTGEIGEETDAEDTEI